MAMIGNKHFSQSVLKVYIKDYIGVVIEAAGTKWYVTDPNEFQSLRQILSVVVEELVAQGYAITVVNGSTHTLQGPGKAGNPGATTRYRVEQEHEYYKSKQVKGKEESAEAWKTGGILLVIVGLLIGWLMSNLFNFVTIVGVGLLLFGYIKGSMNQNP